jgi:hypothetical protein
VPLVPVWQCIATRPLLSAANLIGPLRHGGRVRSARRDTIQPCRHRSPRAPPSRRAGQSRRRARPRRTPAARRSHTRPGPDSVCSQLVMAPIAVLRTHQSVKHAPAESASCGTSDLDSRKLVAPEQMIKDFQTGTYLVYECDRSVRIRVAHILGNNAVRHQRVVLRPPSNMVESGRTVLLAARSCGGVGGDVAAGADGAVVGAGHERGTDRRSAPRRAAGASRRLGIAPVASTPAVPARAWPPHGGKPAGPQPQIRLVAGFRIYAGSPAQRSPPVASLDAGMGAQMGADLHTAMPIRHGRI